VDNVGCHRFRCAGEPGQDIVSIGVGRERVGLDDFCPDWHVLTVDLDRPRSFCEVTGTGSLCGEADDEDRVARVGEEVP